MLWASHSYPRFRGTSCPWQRAEGDPRCLSGTPEHASKDHASLFPTLLLSPNWYISYFIKFNKLLTNTGLKLEVKRRERAWLLLPSISFLLATISGLSLSREVLQPSHRAVSPGWAECSCFLLLQTWKRKSSCSQIAAPLAVCSEPCPLLFTKLPSITSFRMPPGLSIQDSACIGH